MITYIGVDKIHPHPDNPRKDLGDLTELAESIKTSGILQNLTVVEAEGGYRAVIGHRRLAAAKLAGLTEVPCAVSDMDYKTQIAAMLLENMQRSDLTVYEQAQGFQMMISLGETAEGIAKATGFSETTVRKRVKLLELDDKKFMEAQERGATLMDFARLNEVEDLKIRSKVLDDMGTNNFDWALQRALNNQNIKKNKPLIKEELERIATEIKEKDAGKYAYDKHLNYGGWKEGDFIPKDAGKKEYFFTFGTDYGCLYKKKEKAAPVKKSDREKEAEKRRGELRVLTEQAFELRKAFVLEFSAARKHTNEILEFLCKAAVLRAKNYGGFNAEAFAAAVGAEDRYGITLELTARALESDPGNAPLLVAWCETGDGKSDGYVNYGYHDAMPGYKENAMLDLLYEYLVKLGYRMSDEERALRDGTHELFGEEETK